MESKRRKAERTKGRAIGKTASTKWKWMEESNKEKQSERTPPPDNYNFDNFWNISQEM